jgi:CubicO group peptidase (beta-lactamase class C family)
VSDLERRVAKLGRRGHRAVVAGTLRGAEAEVAGWAARGPVPDGATLFEIGSITKALTGILLADMHLAGEVALDDPLSRHHPGPAPAWRHREPTLLELATHRSGLPNVPGPLARRELAHLAGLRRAAPWAGVTAEDFSRLVAAESPKRAPGERNAYSSLGVALLGEALAHRAGLTYEQLVRERVLDPLGMANTVLTVPPQAEGRLLTGHSRRGRPRPPLEDLLGPAGGLRSCADDMLRLLRACLQPPADRLGRALALAQEPQAPVNRGMDAGLCWLVVRRRNAPPLVWHNGGTWGFRSFAGFTPERGTAAIVMTNTFRGVDRDGFALASG